MASRGIEGVNWHYSNRNRDGKPSMSKNSKSNELARSTAAKHRGGIPALDGLRTESDVEQKLIYRVLTAPEWLGISAENIHTKEYLQPKDLDKGRKLKRGYFPDYSIWFDGLPVMIVEAKSPDEDVYEGLREARLYALEMNKQYPTEVNPIEIICASNGSILVYSFWDSDDFQSIAHDQLVPGTRKAEQFRDFCSKSTMMRRVEIINSTAIEKDTFIGSDFLGGQKLLRQRIGFNSFAEPLSPLIKMYFDSESPARFEEIVTLGYVHTDDTTRYHRTLETFLRDKISSIGGAPIKEIQTRKQGEIDLTHKITDAISSDDFFGELQLIIGPVGAGKTIFLHRYFQHLIPRDLRERVAYIYINFNQAPDDLTNLENWLCESFLEVVDKKILNGQLYHIDNLRRIFAPNIRRRDIGVYSHLKKKTPDEYEKKISEDLRIWTEDWQEFAFSTCRFLSGDKGVPIVVAFDNVDRRNRDQQLKIFQTAQWFKAKSRALCLLTLRDETFERYKEEPPLDAFLTSVNFYIQPPRFVDVVRNRLSLALGNLSANAEKRQTFALPNGMYVTYPATELGEYLTAIYVTLFQRRRQITGVLEALSGKNVRRALSMFADILVSKHLSEVIIAKAMCVVRCALCVGVVVVVVVVAVGVVLVGVGVTPAAFLLGSVVAENRQIGCVFACFCIARSKKHRKYQCFWRVGSPKPRYLRCFLPLVVKSTVFTVFFGQHLAKTLVFTEVSPCSKMWFLDPKRTKIL